jgi:hypothetical protein
MCSATDRPSVKGVFTRVPSSCSACSCSLRGGRPIAPSALPPRTTHVDEPELIRSRLATGEAPPLADALPAEIGVFVSAHTHAPSLAEFDRPSGPQGAVVNSGCWLRQLQPLPAQLGAPPVFVCRFVQTHVRVDRHNNETQVELWEHPRPLTQQLRVAERPAVAGRLPAEPHADAAPRVRARTTIDQRLIEEFDTTTGERQ